MRRRRSERQGRRLRLANLITAALLLTPAGAWAQRGIVTQGARELLVPTGARVIGIGQAAAGLTLGTEGLWWNPASVARTRTAEAALHHGQQIGFRAEFGGLLYPVRRVGVAGAGIHYMDEGTSPAFDEEGNPIGVIHSRGIVYLLGFATTLGRRVSAGVNYKILSVQYGVDKGSTTAIDFGGQYALPVGDTVIIGAAMRNLGLGLQVKDQAQADPLPTVWEVGASYATPLAALDTSARVRIAASVIDRRESEGPGFRFGGELGWQGRYFARTGYVLYSGSGSAPSIGLGASTGRLTIDIARVFGDNSSALGEPPTYLSLKVSF